jgi:translation initiation factor 2 subunit 3
MEYKQVIQNQPICNIGTAGHVSNGKSSIIKAISGQATQKHAAEQVRNITIKLGYANAKIWKCQTCDAPQAYQATDSVPKEYFCKHCDSECMLMNHISFTDVPGHNSFMQTMFNGTCVMDGAILVESAANHIFPAPQTICHTNVMKALGIPIITACVNKMDLLQKDKKKAKDLIGMMSKYVGDNIPIIPMSATLDCNIDVLCEYLANYKIPPKDLGNCIRMYVVRSFNVNNAKTDIHSLRGGVVGGTLVRGKLNVSDNIYILPGFVVKINTPDSNKIWKYLPLSAKVLSIYSEKQPLDTAIPGGSIGIQLDIDPALTGDDRLVGQTIVSHIDKFKIFEKITVIFEKFNNVDIIVGQEVNININANNIQSIIKNINQSSDTKFELLLELEKPICVEIGDKIIVNSKKNNHIDDSVIELIGYGIIISGIESETE